MSQSNDISQIRNLIFGETIDEINARFNTLEDGLQRLEERLNSILERLEHTASASDENLKALEERMARNQAETGKQIEAVMKQLDELNRIKTGRDDLAALLAETARKLQTSTKAKD